MDSMHSMHCLWMQARILALLGAVGISVATSAFAPARLAAFLHFTAYGIWLGTMFFNTFIVGLTMFKCVRGLLFYGSRAGTSVNLMWAHGQL